MESETWHKVIGWKQQQRKKDCSELFGEETKCWVRTAMRTRPSIPFAERRMVKVRRC